MSIKELSTDNRWKIVASSFIITPTSAVKELIDNSIDGHSSNITIDIDSKTGGCEYICVRDNGMGVKVEDRGIMCLNHTTSKIKEFDDIDNINTLGFRGEALFLLSSLATTKGSLEVMTRCERESIGECWFVRNDGSMDMNTKRKIPSPVGTCITIRNLMGGLRARKVELESNAMRAIKDLNNLINQYCLEFTDIRFSFSLVSLSKNGSICNKQLQTSRNVGISRVRQLSNMVSLRKPYDLNFFYDENVEINDVFNIDYILPNMLPELEMVNNKKAFKFVSINHRPLSIKLELGHLINKCLNKIFKSFGLLEPLVWYINFTCSGKYIDINIEPEKNNVLINNIEGLMASFELCITNILKYQLTKRNEIFQSRRNSQDNNNHNTSLIVNREVLPIKKNNKIDYINLDNTFDDSNNVNKSISKNNVVKSGNDVTVENNTTIIESDEDADLNKIGLRRTKTTDTIISTNSDDTKWEKLWLDDSNEHQQQRSSSQQTNSNNDDNLEDLPSSLTNNYIQNDFTNDDLELSKDLSLSNPFTISKLRSSKKTKDKEKTKVQMETREQMKCKDKEKGNQQEKNKKPIVTSQVTETRKRRDENQISKNMKSQNEYSPDQETNISFKRIKRPPIVQNTIQEHPIIKGRRTLKLFSEYTNSYILSLTYHSRNSTINEFEKECGIMKQESNLITDSLMNMLETLTNGEDQEVEKELQVRKEGWYFFSPPQGI